VDVRVDECRREHEAVRVDDAVLVRIEPLADLRDDAVVDTDVERRVDAVVEHTRVAEDDVRLRTVLHPEHQATSAAASARTPTGPPVSTS
jgi:hypothetical protein